MAETTISDLNNVISSMSGNEGVLTKIQSVANQIKVMGLNSDVIKEINDNSNGIKSVCKQGLKNVFIGVRDLAEVSAFKDSNGNVINIDNLTKKDSNNSLVIIKNIITSISNSLEELGGIDVNKITGFSTNSNEIKKSISNSQKGISKIKEVIINLNTSLGDGIDANDVTTKITNLFSNVSNIFTALDVFEEGKSLYKFLEPDAAQQKIVDAWDNNEDNKNLSDEEKKKLRPKEFSVIDGRIAKIQTIVKSLNTLSKSIYIPGEGNETKGLYGALNSLNIAITNKGVKEVFNKSPNDYSQPLTKSFGIIEAILNSLTPYGEDGGVMDLLKYEDITVTQVLKDKDGNPILENGEQKTTNVTKRVMVAESYITKLSAASTIIKKYTDILYKPGVGDRPAAGLIPNLNSFNKALDELSNSKMQSINKDGFEKLAGVIKTVFNDGLDILGDVALDINLSDSNDILKMLTGGANGQVDQISKVIKQDVLDNNGKKIGEKLVSQQVDVASKDLGLIPIMASFIKIISGLTDPEKGLIANIGKINLSKLPKPEKTKEVFGYMQNFIGVIINSLKELGALETKNKESMTNADEYVQKIQSITSAINSILQSILDMCDPKKNPLLGNPISILIVKIKIRQTFKNLLAIIFDIKKHLVKLRYNLRKIDLESIEKTTNTLNNIFKAINEIIDNIFKFAKRIVLLIIISPIVLIGLMFFRMIILAIMGIYKYVSIALNKMNVADMQKATKNVKDLISELNALFIQLELVALHMIILVPCMLIIILASPIILLGLFLFSLIINGMVKIIKLINKKELLAAKLLIIQVIMVLLLFVLVAATLILLQEVVKQLDWEELSWSLLGILGVIVVIVIAGFICKALGTALAIAMLAILAVTLGTLIIIKSFIWIAEALNELNNIELNTDKVREKVQDIMGAVGEVIAAIFSRGDDTDSKESDKGFFKTILTNLFTGAASLIGAIMSIAYLALMVVSIALVLFIANSLRVLQIIDLDPEKIRTNVSTVMSTANSIIESIFNPTDDTDPKPAKPSLRSLLKWAFPGPTALIESMMTLGYLATMMMAIGTITIIAKNLSYISKLPSMNGIDKKTKDIVKAAKGVVTAIFDSKTGDIEKISESAEKSIKYLKKISSVTSQLESISKNFNKLALMDKKQIDNSNTSIKAMLSCLTTPFENQKEFSVTKVNAVLKVIQHMNNMLSMSSKGFDNSKELLKNYTEFVTKVDNADLAKLKTTVKMFEQMNKFSESINGNFDKLAESLNEKIAPLLEELKESMGRVADNSDKPTDMQAEKNSIKTQMQANGQTQNMTEREIDTKVNNRYNEQQQQKLGIDEITSKLTALINLFQSGEAIVRTS